MKIATGTILVFTFIALTSALHLSKETERDVPMLREQGHLRTYYGRHYRSHRSEEYVHRTVQDNLKMINDFNNKNQKSLKSAGPGSTVSGGNSFAMEPNKFIEFSEKEFLQLFTGAKPPAKGKGKHHDQEELNHMTGQTQQSHQSSQSHDGWVYENPYKIDDHELDLLYGSVNSDDNWGWDWKSFDENYYEDDFSNDFQHFWDDWEKDHQDANKNGQDTWWDDWFGEEDKNKNNDKWWNDDSWNNNSNNKTSPTPNNNTTPGKRAIAEYPKTAVEVNWVTKKATTHIKQQGECGSCWSFTAIGVVESYLLIMGQGTMDLSEQQLVDCQTTGSSGCNGGWPTHALNWVVKNGLVAEEKYPYRGVQQKCIHSSGPHKIPSASQISGRTNIENALRKGPVGGAVHADRGFQFYSKGIFDKCLTDDINHAIVLVGFTKDYWIIRNSWGADWGEDGHMRIKKDQSKNNACSIESFAFAIGY